MKRIRHIEISPSPPLPLSSRIKFSKKTHSQCAGGRGGGVTLSKGRPWKRQRAVGPRLSSVTSTRLNLHTKRFSQSKDETPSPLLHQPQSEPRHIAFVATLTRVTSALTFSLGRKKRVIIYYTGKEFVTSRVILSTST